MTEVRDAGLAWRGAFHPDPADGVPQIAAARPVRTLVMLGFVGAQQWGGFSASAEYADGDPDPLDRWSRRLIGALARRHGGIALDPAAGPPWWPFQRWAQRAEPVYASPLGILIHPEWGLWHAYRGALGLPSRLVLPERDERPSPCATCLRRPCLDACPVGAIAAAGYDAAACASHVAGAAGGDCRGEGCRARRSCPVGMRHRYGPDQAAFHMRAFLARRQ